MNTKSPPLLARKTTSPPNKKSDKELHAEWGAMTQLDDDEIDSVNLLTDRCKERLIPDSILNKWDKKLSAHSQPNSRGITPESVNGIKISNLLGLPTTPQFHPQSPLNSSLTLPYSPSGSSTQLNFPEDDSREVFDSAGKFKTWFSQQEEDLKVGQELLHREYKTQLLNYETDFEILSQNISKNMAELSLIKEEFGKYKQLTNQVTKLSKGLMEDQAKLTQKQSLIEDKLKYANELQNIQKFLNQPGIQIIHRKEFIPLLATCDSCLKYFKSFEFYKDSPILIAKFSQCLVKGLSLIPLGLGDVLKRVTDNCLLEKTELNDLTPPMITKLYYNPYYPITLQYKALIEEIENRTTVESEYQTILSDCQSSLVTYRRRIVDFIMPKFLKKHHQSFNDEELIHWLNDSITKLEFLIDQELDLYSKFFESSNYLLDDHCDATYKQFLAQLPYIIKPLQSTSILQVIMESIVEPLIIRVKDKNYTKSNQILQQLINLLKSKLA